MKFGLGLGLGRKNKAGVSASFSVALTGLTGGVAIIGTHASISYTTDPVSATETVKWSASSDPGAAATYGTGASPTDFTSADGFSLYLHVTDGGETVTRSALVRKAQATGGVDLDLAFPEDSAIASTDLTANWTTNGNTLTYAIVGTALPTGLSVSSAGAMTGTPTTITADATYTLRGTDEYGRTTDDTFTLEITAAAAGTITIDTMTYTRGTAGVAPTLATTVSSTGTTAANYTLRGVLAATAQTQAQIDASGNKFEITAATLAALDGSIDLSNSETAGVISAYVFDSTSGTTIKSAVVTETGVTYDAAAPAFSSAEVGTVDATSLIVTFDKALYGSTSASDWDVQVNGSPDTESAASISGSTVDITLGAAVTNGQTVTVAYNGTGLVGVDAEVVATFTAQSVTNNVAAGVTLNETTWTSSEYLNLQTEGVSADTTTGMTIAMKTRLSAANAYLFGFGFDCYLRRDNSTTWRMVLKDTGDATRYTNTSIAASTTDGAEVSFLLIVNDTANTVDLWIDGTKIIDAASLTAGTDLYMPLMINAILSGGTSATTIGMFCAWVSNAATSGSYSDFFDGSGDPTTAMFNGSTIGGAAPQFSESGDAAAWAALTGMTGTPTDV